MALSDIINKIKDDAAKEAAAIEAAGQAEYEKAIADKNKEIMDALAGLKRTNQARLAKMEEQAAFRSRMIKKNADLRFKQEIIDEVFVLVKDKLAELNDKDCFRLYERMLLDAPGLPEGELIASKRRAEIVRQAVKAAGLKYRLSDKRLPAGQEGFIISSDSIEINSTLDNYVAVRRKEFEAEAANRLFND